MLLEKHTNVKWRQGEKPTAWTPYTNSTVLNYKESTSLAATIFNGKLQVEGIIQSNDLREHQTIENMLNDIIPSRVDYDNLQDYLR